MIIRKQITVQITKVTIDKDDIVYVTIFHPLAQHRPTLRFKTESFEKFKQFIEEDNEK